MKTNMAVILVPHGLDLLKSSIRNQEGHQGEQLAQPIYT